MEATTSKFQDIINSSEYVLVDFHATWCGPCMAMKPILQNLKKKVGDSVRIIKIDVDKNQGLSQKFNVRGIPTLILFKNGKQVWRESGVVSSEDLHRVIQRR